VALVVAIRAHLLSLLRVHVDVADRQAVVRDGGVPQHLQQQQPAAAAAGSS
jgi:hypothetical protein